MSKAGLFGGEVGSSAPANGAPTTKPRGYTWMQSNPIGFNQLVEALSPKRLYYFQDVSFLTGAADSGSDAKVFSTGGTNPAVAATIRQTQSQSAEILTNNNRFFEETGAGTVQGDYVTSKSYFTITVGFDHYLGLDEWYHAFDIRGTRTDMLFGFGSRENLGLTPHTGWELEWRNDDGTYEILSGAEDMVAAGGNIATFRRNGNDVSMFVNGAGKVSKTSLRSSMHNYAGKGFDLTTWVGIGGFAVASLRYDVCAIWDTSISDADIYEYHAQWLNEI